MVDLTGKKFGYLTALRVVGETKWRNKIWECRCECGKLKNIPSSKLIQGRATNCGCKTTEIKRKTASKHGITANGKPRTFTIWEGMKARCLNPKDINYHNYGARGISICNEWLTYENFHKWAIANGYKENLQIDRIDNDGDYEPSNCRWVTRQQNARNKRNSRNITVIGITLPISVWCKELNMSRSTAYRHLATIEDVIYKRILTGKGQTYFVNKFIESK